MKILLKSTLVLFLSSLFLLHSSFAQNLGTGGSTRQPPTNQIPRTAPSYPQVQPPQKWEYLIWEVRIGGGAQKLPEYCLHMPNGSSRVYHQWSRAFRDRGFPVISSSKIDDVNALNSLGLLGWELITIAVQEEAGQRVLFHYCKRPSQAR